MTSPKRPLGPTGDTSPPAKRQQNYSTYQEVDRVCVDSVRCLAAALPQQANSGHPGAPMGCAPIAHVLWSYVMNYSPSNCAWWSRDRFVLSNGHACALHYSMLHLTGYPVKMEDLKNFRQLHSITAGHPESHVEGIEVTTGPLGQGIAQAVGLAVAERHLAAEFNTPEIPLIDNYTYVICGDGCLQEGVASEACSLAGHLKLGKLILLYDNNNITIDGNTKLSFSEDVLKRFEAYGWHTSEVQDGDKDVLGIKTAIERAKAVTDQPSIISVKTTIGFGSKKEGSEKTHGAPLGVDDLSAARAAFGLEGDMWTVAPEVLAHYKEKGKAGDVKCAKWESEMWAKYKVACPGKAKDLERRFKRELPAGWEDMLPKYDETSKPAATRVLSNESLNAVAKCMPEIFGGSADLTESNKSHINGTADFSPASLSGRYVRYGVREHGMAAICNGLFAYGALRPYGATFLNFITYAWGAVRLAAVADFGVLQLATHDSIELGEDGPTHQPVELLPLVRATPNMLLVRPADGNECNGAYRVWLGNPNRPTIMALCRSNVNHIKGSRPDGVLQGAYVIKNFDETRKANHRVILAGSGSEMQIVVEAGAKLEEKHASVAVRIVSMPCWELFAEQPAAYKEEVLPASHRFEEGKGSITKLYCEASITLGWGERFDISVGMESFGASAPKKDLWKHFGFTPENVVSKVEKHLGL